MKSVGNIIIIVSLLFHVLFVVVFVSAFTPSSTITLNNYSNMIHRKQHQQQRRQQSTTTTTEAEGTTSSSSSSYQQEVLLGTVKSHHHCTDPKLDRTILVRAALGEITERTPVWLMRQAGRYMKAFRQYSDFIPFRQRSETPEIAIELSMQCHRAYGMDGIIMFSDILTPLPCINIDFDVVKGVGPVITTHIRTEEHVQQIVMLQQQQVQQDNKEELYQQIFNAKVPFIKDILASLKQEAIQANTALIGFVGAPYTLAAYTLEGKSSKHCEVTKELLLQDSAGTNKCISLLINEISTLIGNYACYQIEHGAEVIQIFESWAHQLSPQQFQQYAKPAAMKVISIIKSKYPNVPVIYFANGGSSYLELQKDMGCDMIAIDWSIEMKQARAILGPDMPISGNIDPAILKFGTKEQIEMAVMDCIDQAGGPGNRHILNLGHGVMQGTPEIKVQYLIDACKRYTK
jgi:uroporphyrinogen decarboxylase